MQLDQFSKDMKKMLDLTPFYGKSGKPLQVFFSTFFKKPVEGQCAVKKRSSKTRPILLLLFLFGVQFRPLSIHVVDIVLQNKYPTLRGLLHAQHSLAECVFFHTHTHPPPRFHTKCLKDFFSAFDLNAQRSISAGV